MFFLLQLWFIIFDLAGGAVNDVPANATAFVHRNTIVSLSFFAASFHEIPNIS